MARDDEGELIAAQNWRTMPVASIRQGTLGVVRGAVLACSKSGKKAGKMRLISMPHSPYCEKVRWALDLTQVEYTEDAHPPAFHGYATLRASNGRASCTPMLVMPNGTATWDSTTVLKRLALTFSRRVGFLYPPGIEGAVEAMEDYFDENLGPHTRQWQYSFTLHDESLAKAFFTKFSAAVERWLLPFVYPDLRKGLSRAVHADGTHRALSLAEIRTVFRHVEQQLADGRKFLCGDHFTAADLTFAALAVPVLHPPQLKYLLPPTSELPSAMTQTIHELRSTVAGTFALRMYTKYRFPRRSTVKHVIPRSHGRDQVPWIILLVLLSFFLLILALLRFLFNLQR